MMIVIFLFALCASMLAACTGGGPAAGSSAPPAEGGSSAAAEGGTEGGIVIYVGTVLFDQSLDPVKGAMSWGYSCISSALLKVAPDSTYVGDMAESWEPSADALTYTYTLKEGLKFSDGSDLTAEDVVFTYETIRDNQAENGQVDLTRLASAEAVDDRTVRFSLSEPYSPFVDTTARIGIVPSDAYDADAFTEHPIGSGPWKVLQYDANQQIILAPNEYYYEGAPSIPQVTVVNLDENSALAAAKSGQLDVVMVDPNYVDEPVDGMHIQRLETMDIRMFGWPVQPEGEVMGQEGYEITFGNAVTSDLAVRKALAIGLDRQAIVDNAFNGVGKPAVSFTDNLVWAAPGDPADNRKEEAKALLEEAGWVDTDGDGIREKDGVDCAFNVYAAENARYLLAVAVAQDALELGVQINAISGTWDDVDRFYRTSAVVYGYGQYDPVVLKDLLYSDYYLTDAFSDAVGYDNPQVDALIDKAVSEPTQEGAVADWKQVQEVANADYPYLYLVNMEHCYFIKDGLDISLDTQIPHPHGHGVPIINNMKDWTLG
ncbi:MAG: ABC transporter substrate-binding protein [Clostridiales Family XIII bacterium]|jgi:peptide/nickel transport system substrate-binding protein|nr:ABC transporter substrate-binding protein [Clostridiales Family XIII bacterium]